MQLIIFYVVVKRPKWPYWLLSFICVFIIIDHPIRVPMGSFSLIMLDVGQGLSIWIKPIIMLCFMILVHAVLVSR